MKFEHNIWYEIIHQILDYSGINCQWIKVTSSDVSIFEAEKYRKNFEKLILRNTKNALQSGKDIQASKS